VRRGRARHAGRCRPGRLRGAVCAVGRACPACRAGWFRGARVPRRPEGSQRPKGTINALRAFPGLAGRVMRGGRAPRAARKRAGARRVFAQVTGPLSGQARDPRGRAFGSAGHAAGPTVPGAELPGWLSCGDGGPICGQRQKLGFRRVPPHDGGSDGRAGSPVAGSRPLSCDAQSELYRCLDGQTARLAGFFGFATLPYETLLANWWSYFRVHAARSSRCRWVVRVRSSGLPVHQASSRIRLMAAAAVLCSRRVLPRPR